jgi:predicted ATPase/DNA-binding CsgD family transcriptional regulator
MKKNSYSNSFRVAADRSRSKALRKKKGSQSLPSGDETTAPTHTTDPSLLKQYIPTPLLPLIGREQEVGAICDLLQQLEVRLLTLTGPGGVGKTRLALQIPDEVYSTFTDGICFVSLIPISAADLVFSTIAQALGLTERQNYSALAQIQAAIRDKRFLLILDNFERVAIAAPQLRELLAVCPQLQILVTSRIVLGLLEEQEFYVTPLALPDLAQIHPCEDLSQVAAVSLFLQRVRTVRPDFELTSNNVLAVAQICICLDGLPLALELAAARMKLFSPQSLLTRLDHRLSVLTSGPRDAPGRQRTLSKTIEWSYDLLTPGEQRLFRRLSVFVGGCSLQAIEAISSDMTDEPDEPILNIVTSLLNQSLFQREPQASNQEQRFTMLETIREYAWEHLQSSEEEETTRQMHAEYYLELAKTLELKVMGGEPPYWIAWIEREFENLRAAFCWFLVSHDAERALEMSGALWAFWLQNSTAEGYTWISQALECCERSVTSVETDTIALAMHAAAMLGYYRSNWTQADKLADESLQLFRTTDNARGTAWVLITQGIGALLRGQYSVANAVANESLRVLQKTSCSWISAEALLVLAYSCYFQGDYLQAYTVGKKCFKLSRQTGELYAMIRAVHAYALFSEAQGNFADVQRMHEEVISITRETIKTGASSSVAVCLVGLGAIAVLEKQYTWAVSLWGKAKALYRRGDGLSELEARKWLVIILGTHLLYSQVVKTVYTQLGEQAFTAAWNEGQTMTLEKLLMSPKPQKSFTPLPSSASEKVSVAYSDELTPREQEVLRLLAQALSSALIANRLGISLVTVNSHIRAIYSKLGVSSRSAATRFAIEHRLV